jgi:phosphoribosylglycinamide formyltransferase 1
MAASAQSVQNALPRLAIFLSGRGSNAKAIVRSVEQGTLQAQVALVVSNRWQAPGLAWMQAKGIATYTFNAKTIGNREAVDRQVLAVLQAHAIDIVALAGYDRIVSPVLTQAFVDGRMVNIHPSLLPAFGGPGMVGVAVHDAVLVAGVPETGCTVHEVTDQVDGGPIIAQAVVPVQPGDSVDTLAARVLSAEHQLYPAAVQALLARLFPPGSSHSI